VRGRRIEKNVNGTVTKYLYDGDSLLAEHDSSDNLLRNYFYGTRDINPSILYEGGSVYYFNHDHLNTPQKITDESGTTVWEAIYKSFGGVSMTTENVSNNFRFPGQFYDEESGLHYNYHRYYGTKTGRYLREDPIGLEGGINLYVYAGDNPLNRIDPRGLKGCGPGSGLLEKLIPDYPAGYDFSGCCDEHDDCYGCEGKAQGRSRRDCDSQFCKCLIKECLFSTGFGNFYRPCPSLTYCLFVIGFGDDAFKNARRCCP
jgi:RHS repeat-associated protein